MSNAIPLRIADTLKKFPPFSLLEEATVLAIAEQATVSVSVKQSVVWEVGQNANDRLLFLARGRVEYHWKHENEFELVDVRDVGDLLGLTALHEGKPFVVRAVTAEDSLFYEFSWKLVKPLIEANDLARNYIRRHLFWATRLGHAIPLPNQTSARIASRTKNILQSHLDGAQQITPRPDHRLLTCAPDTSIREAAANMVAQRVPSMLVASPEQHPLGILTYRDIVEQIIVEGRSEQDPVERIMSSPVVTVENGSSSTAALLLMLRERIGQVCVTEDGTDKSALLDVCTEKDLLAQTGHHPAGLLREIRSTESVSRLREICDDLESIIRSYLDSGVSSIFVGQISAEIYDELVQNLVHLKLRELEKERYQLPDVPWTWIAVGSDGRREQLLRTDIDNGILFASTGDAKTDEAHREAFTQLGSAVIDGMMACGFAKCQGGVMALNPRWCRTEVEWQEEIQTVKAQPEADFLLRAIIAFDMRRVCGDAALFDALRKHLFAEISEAPALLRRIAENIVATPPPLNFLKQFVVERRGSHEGQFDIKARALTPIRGAAQILAFKYKLMRRYSTGGRWQDIHAQVESLREVAAYAEEAYEYLLRLRTLNGLRRGDSGRFLEPDSISKLERAQLTHSFDVVRMVQHALRNEFHLESRR
ncbi:MAG: DUF294 nucleotidyltransferase-like domain-containing protein [Puniceicoccaceae bacterium]